MFLPPINIHVINKYFTLYSFLIFIRNCLSLVTAIPHFSLKILIYIIHIFIVILFAYIWILIFNKFVKNNLKCVFYILDYWDVTFSKLIKTYVGFWTLLGFNITYFPNSKILKYFLNLNWVAKFEFWKLPTSVNLENLKIESKSFK